MPDCLYYIKGIEKPFTENELVDYLLDQDLSNLKTIQDAIQVRGTEEVLQRPQARVGEAGGERTRVEPSKQRQKIAIEGEGYEKAQVESPRERKKALLNTLLSAKNISEETKYHLEKNDIYFEANSIEAENIAKSIVSSLGVESAIIAAKTNEVHPSVGSAIFAESINYLWRQEQKLRNEGKIKEANDVALRQADLIIEYSDISTSSGQWIAQIKRFYKTSPMGIVSKINTERKQTFKTQFAGQEDDLKAVFNEMLKGEEGQALIKQKADEIIKEERKQERKEKKDRIFKKIDDTAKLWIQKLTSSYSKDVEKMGIGVEEIVNTAAEAMKKAYAAGEPIFVVLEDAVKYISDKLGTENWDIQGFKKDWTEKLGESDQKENAYANALDRRRKELERRIKENDFSAEKYKEKKTLSEKEADAKKELDSVKELYDEAKKQSPEYINKKAKQYLERFKSRLEGLDNAKKEEVIKRSMIYLVKNGALEYDEFKNIIAESIGLKELTPDDVSNIESLMEKINSTKDLEDEMVKTPTPETIKKYDDAVNEASMASTELYNIVSKGSNITNTIKSLITGSLLGIPSLIKNPIQNILFQGQLRFPKLVVKNIIEQGFYGASILANKYISSESPIYKPKSSILLAQKGYFPQGKRGIFQGATYFKEGVTVPDFNSKNAYQSSLSPKQAVKDLELYKKGEKYLTKAEVIDRYIRKSWPARRADFVLRAMGFGDLPQRYAAEGAAAQQIAVQELGLLNDIEIIAFMRSPQKMAYKILTEQGNSKAAELSQEIQDRIIKEGEKAVFQEKNILSSISENIDRSLAIKKDDKYIKVKAAASIFKTLNYPFVKIPANVAWASFKAANPLFSMLQAGYQANEARKYENKGEWAKSREYKEMSKDSFAHAAVGLGLLYAASFMVAAGFVRPENDKDTKAKEAAGEEAFGKQNQLNLGGMLGLDEYWIDLTWFGPYGVILNTEAQLQRDKKAMAEKGEEQSQIMDQIDRMTYSAKSSLNQLIFDQGSKMVNAVMGGWSSAKGYFVNNIVNNLTNLPTGAEYVQISKGLLPYKAQLKGETAWEQIVNNQKQRNVALRVAMNLYKPESGNPPSKISVFTGEPIKNDNTPLGIIGSMMGAEKGSNDKFGAVIMNDFEKTGDLKFLPPSPVTSLTIKGKKINLPLNEQRELQILIGKSTKEFVSPFVYGGATLENSKRYTDPNTTDTEKADALSDIYDLARQNGLKQFKLNHPMYKESELTSMEEMLKERNEDWKANLKIMFNIQDD